VRIGVDRALDWKERKYGTNLFRSYVLRKGGVSSVQDLFRSVHVLGRKEDLPLYG
jgi:hypothetical protein